LLAASLALPLVAFGGCTDAANSSGSGSQDSNDTLSGSLTDLVGRLYGTSASRLAPGEEFVMHLEAPVTAENCTDYLGLSPQDFESHVEEALVSYAGISAIAHQVALIKCKGDASASKVSALVATGFNTGRWICVRPGTCFVQTSGSYVLFVASSTSNADALVAGFSELAEGNVGMRTTFYTSDETSAGAPGDGSIVVAPGVDEGASQASEPDASESGGEGDASPGDASPGDEGDTGDNDFRLPENLQPK
jgi:hypothetical protein